tara:strand:+ start:514 stop:702 length:189 start_codon:yes stop_codon:yes gene_type:complete
MDNPIDKYSPFVPIDLRIENGQVKQLNRLQFGVLLICVMVIKHLLSQWALKEKIECLICCVN